jgi:non-canonical purine NTP pyrophosphatase (RdgB/HAM1 family)
VELLIASTNSGKINEFREMLQGGEDIRFTDLREHGNYPVVEETGQTFLANACLKAGGYARMSNAWSLADDSGLAVDALDGKPGVFSARWAAMHDAGDGDEANNALLLKQLASTPEKARTARFVCALALAEPGGKILLTASGAVHGRVLTEPRGENGFGYDPLFFIEALGKTTAELPPEQKHKISHRGQALRRLAALLDRIGTPFRMNSIQSRIPTL